MSSIQGFDQLQKQLSEAGAAFKEIDGEITTLRFDPADHSSVEAAIADMMRAIDTRLAAYAGNPLVENVAQQMKANFRAQIMARASEMREKEMSIQDASTAPDQALFRQIDNAVADLRSADQGGFTRHIRKLSRLLHEPSVEAISQELISSVDVDAVLAAGARTQGGMIGSAKIPWPANPREELGFVIAMIDRFAKDEQERDGWGFAHTFYNNGRSLTANLQNMVGQMIVPFARDYISFVKDRSDSQATEAPARQPAEPTTNVHISGGTFHNSPIGVGQHVSQQLNLQTASTEQLIDRLRDEVKTRIADTARQEQIIAKLDDLRDAHDKPSRIERYMSLMGAVGDHITVLSFLLTPLLHSFH